MVRAGKKRKSIDPQVVELLGRNKLVNDLLRAGLEVALPMRDRGIDLIAYLDLRPKFQTFVARPIQMKAALHGSFSINRKYSKIRDLLIAYVWSLGEAGEPAIYALSHDETVDVAKEMGYTKTNSWKKRGRYGTTNPGKKLVSLLAPYRMTPEKWWDRITEAIV